MAPAPFGCTMLADMGAEIVLVERVPVRASLVGEPETNPLRRGRRSVCLDLKSTNGRDLLLELISRADVLVEGFRPGVAERLGFGPDVATARNPRLIYARMTGWGQTGPLATTAGHDINYIAASGALSTMGPAGQPPVPPTNGMGDFAGGGMVLALGVLAALYERERSGVGQVLDVAMLDGSAMLTAYVLGEKAAGRWTSPRGKNMMDGAYPSYRTYETSDRRHVAVGALEPAFYQALLDGLGLGDSTIPDRADPSTWDALSTLFADRFRSRTQAEWARTFTGTDACVTPVLDAGQVLDFPHNSERDVFSVRDGYLQPNPAPRFSRTPSVAGKAPALGADSAAVLSEIGLTADQRTELQRTGVTFGPTPPAEEMRLHE